LEPFLGRTEPPLPAPHSGCHDRGHQNEGGAGIRPAGITMLDRLHHAIPWLSYLAATLVLLAAAEAGQRIGAFRRRRGQTATSEITTLEGAMLGLLALMVGFTFSIALSRFDARRQLLLDDANAIGTAALRARLLPEPYASDAQRFLRQYAQIRIDLMNGPPAAAMLQSAIDRSNVLQNQLWRQAIAVTAADPHSIPAGLFVQALNDMIDIQEKRLIAYGNHAPTAVFVLLYSIAMVAVGFTGYSAGLAGPQRRIPNVIAVLLIAFVIGLVGDIDRPLTGFVTISQKPMLDLMATLSQQGR
jgi:hypothetical protein